MNNQSEKPEDGLFNPIKTLAACLLATLAGVYPAFAGQAFTGKIVIDGQAYGENNANILKGNGVMGRDKRAVDDFHSIKVLGSVNVNYRRAKDVQVAVTGDQNLLPIITTKVSNGILTIDSTKNYQTQLPLTVELSSPKLSDVSLDGSGDMSLQGLNDKALNLNISGSSNVTADGTVERLVIRIGGSGDVNAKSLESEQADVSITGSGDISVTAKDSLKASIVGSGDITYFGHPKKVDPSVLGSGDIEAGD
jgi:uncharacterized protein YabE (DUF348 family)